MPRTPAAQTEATETATQKPRTRQNDFAGTVKELRTWATMYLDVLKKVGGETPNEFTKGQQDILNDVLAKLGTK